MANETRPGAVGQAIEDPRGGALKQFMADPKNLATLLVLGTALAQPRRGGRNQLGHALRSATGALAFRGALDTETERRAAQQKEAESQQAARAAAADAQTTQAQAAASRAATAQQGMEQEAALTREGFANQLEIERMRQAGRPQATLADNYAKVMQEFQLQAMKGYQEALSLWEAGGRNGPPPNMNAMREEAFKTALMVLNPNFSFEPDQQPTGQDAIVVPTPEEVRRERQAPEPPAHQDVFKTRGDRFNPRVPADRARATVARKLRRDLPAEVTEGMSDEQVVGLAQQIDAGIKNRLSTMSQEEARDLLRKKTTTRFLSEETFRALREKARGKTDQAQILENIGRSGAL